MDTTFASKCLHLDNSLLGHLGNNVSSFLSSYNQMAPSNLLYQQQRAFIQMRIRAVQMRTVLNVADNSGAKKVMCISPVVKGPAVADNSGTKRKNKKAMCMQPAQGKKGAGLGDIIVASVKEAMPDGKVKKGKVVYGVVVRAASRHGRRNGSEVKCDDNAVVLLDGQGQPFGTRVFGPIPHELRERHAKILSLAKQVF